MNRLNLNPALQYQFVRQGNLIIPVKKKRYSNICIRIEWIKMRLEYTKRKLWADLEECSG